ncbi:hypothetical protein BD770DRAFT_445662 [Pilaira anomala]|nr:hypothetical protein BD770DRAFT_445662 [Pilaira anomala]
MALDTIVPGMERVVIEGSSGQTKESIPKTVYDGVKQVHNMLKSVANTDLNTSFETFQEVRIYGIQSIKSKIILSEMFFNNGQGKNTFSKKFQRQQYQHNTVK